MTVHQDLCSGFKEKNAIFLGDKTISHLCLDALRKDLEYTSGATIEVTKKPYGVSLKSVSTSSGRPVGEVEATLTHDSDGILLRVYGGLVLEVDLGIVDAASNLSDVFASVKMIVKDISFLVEATSNKVICTPNHAEFIPTLTRVSDKELEAILVKHQLDRDDVARVEGLVAYSAIQTLITSSLNKGHEISLSKLFPGIKLKGLIDAEVLGPTNQSNSTLCIFPHDGFGSTPDLSCECSDIGDGMGDLDPGTISDNRDTGTTDPAGSITIGLPRVPNPSDVELGRRDQGVGDVGIYFPQSEIQSFGSDAYPGVVVKARDNGFIGWRATASAAFSKSSVRLDDRRGAIVVELVFEVEVSGKVHVDLGKLGKQTICNFDADQKRDSKLVVAFIPVIARGQVSLKPVIELLKCGNFDVEVNIGKLTGTPFGTKGAVIGFIVDEILSHNITMKLPRKIRKEIRKYMAKNAFRLIDADEWVDLIPQNNPRVQLPLYALHSSIEDTLLVSTMYNG